MNGRTYSVAPEPNGGDPRGVRLHNLLHGFNETLLREAGHLEALGGVVHALSVHIGAETYDGASSVVYA